MVTGGWRYEDGYRVSARAEVLDYGNKTWREVASMRYPRVGHSCAQVWLDPADPDILHGMVTNTSVLSIVVAGGKV